MMRACLLTCSVVLLLAGCDRSPSGDNAAGNGSNGDGKSAPAADARPAPPLADDEITLPPDHPPVDGMTGTPPAGSATELPPGHPPLDGTPNPARAAPDDGLPPGHPPIGAMTDTPDTPSRPPVSPPPADDDRPRVRFAAPTVWVAEPIDPDAMIPRDAQYRLPAAGPDTSPGELAVFNMPIGGSVEMNIDRWRGQFTTAEGQPIPDSQFVREDFVAHGLNVVMVDIQGRPVAGDEQGDYRMLAAIIDHPNGRTFVKALGPAETMADHRETFVTFLKSAEFK